MRNWFRSKEKVCKTCRRYRADFEGDGAAERRGLCVRKSPIAVVLGEKRQTIIGAFPSVSESAGCSEWNRGSRSWLDMD